MVGIESVVPLRLVGIHAITPPKAPKRIRCTCACHCKESGTCAAAYSFRAFTREIAPGWSTSTESMTQEYRGTPLLVCVYCAHEVSTSSTEYDGPLVAKSKRLRTVATPRPAETPQPLRHSRPAIVPACPVLFHCSASFRSLTSEPLQLPLTAPMPP